MKNHVQNYFDVFRISLEASRGAAARGVTVKTDWLWVQSPLEEMKY